MGILNVTPDSFSDGGAHDTTAAAVAHGLRLIAEGADLLDIGGESTRPGAVAVPLDEELRRVVPVVAELARQCDRPISIDTRKAEVARQALAAGACIVNDVTALTGDSAMADVICASGAGVVLMHMRGTPADMQLAPHYDDVLAEVSTWLARRREDVVAQGIAAEQLVLDPGIGFGKTLEHNLALLAGLERLAGLGAPLLVGLSRKRFIGQLTGAPVDDRLAGSLAGLVWCLWHGASILRVHDVKASCEAVRVATAIAGGRSER